MHRDLKLLFWIFMLSFILFVVYTIVDYTFAALDNPKAYAFYKSYTETFTNKPDKYDPDVRPDSKWKGGREPLPFLGYIHYSVVFLITGILVVVILGFIIIYLSTKQQE